MENIDNIIEIKRGLHKIWGRDVVTVIAETEKCADFYRNIFTIYGLMYNTETIMQKREFIAASTKYFILDRLPEDILCVKDGKYETRNKKELKKLLEDTINIFYTIRNTSNSDKDFKKKYAEHFNEVVKDFSKEISENRDDSLSDFAKTIRKIYNSKDKNDDC